MLAGVMVVYDNDAERLERIERLLQEIAERSKRLEALATERGLLERRTTQADRRHVTHTDRRTGHNTATMRY
jgi:hypothetical protein